MVVSLGFSGVNEAIKADFIERLPKFHKSRCEGLIPTASISDSVGIPKSVLI